MKFKICKPYKVSITSVNYTGNVEQIKKRFHFAIAALAWAWLQWFIAPANSLIITKKGIGWIFKWHN